MPARATWVWDRPDPEELVAWSARKDVRELFVGVRRDLPTSPDLSWVRAVVRQASAAGIRVAALGGDKGWISRPEDGVAWARAVGGTRLFDGLHLDIEVWAPDPGPEHTDQVPEYLALLRRLVAVSTLPVEVDLAHWLHGVPAAGTTLDAEVMRIVDAVTVLSYRNTPAGPDSIAAIGAPGLGAAGRAGVRCRLAVETQYLGDDPVARKQTFHGLGLPALETATRKVDELHASTAAYRGIAIHDYRNWRAL